MKRTTHSRFFQVVFAAALVLIVGVFGLAAYILVTSNLSLEPGVGFDPRNAVLIIGAGVGLLALLTGAFYLVARLDTRLQTGQNDEDEDNATPYAVSRTH